MNRTLRAIVLENISQWHEFEAENVGSLQVPFEVFNDMRHFEHSTKTAQHELGCIEFYVSDDNEGITGTHDDSMLRANYMRPC